MSMSLLAASGVHDPVYRLYSRLMPVDHKAIVRVGADKDYATVAEGIAAADALVYGSDRALVIIDAGTYNEQLWSVKNVDLAGATGNPEDVVIENTCPTGFSPLNTTGGPLWIGGLTSRLLPYPDRTGSGVYSVHHHGGKLTVYERVILDGPTTGAIGMDGDEGSETWMVECDWLNHVEGYTLATNMHGSAGNVIPLRLVYDRCLAPGLGLNYNNLGVGSQDELYVVGCTVEKVNVGGAGVTAVIDPNVPVIETVDGVTILRDTSLPPRPYRGKPGVLDSGPIVET